MSELFVCAGVGVGEGVGLGDGVGVGVEFVPPPPPHADNERQAAAVAKSEILRIFPRCSPMMAISWPIPFRTSDYLVLIQISIPKIVVNGSSLVRLPMVI